MPTSTGDAVAASHADVPDRLQDVTSRRIPSPTRQLRRIIVLSVVLRVAWAFAQGGTVTTLPGTADQWSYDALALRVIDGHGFTFGTAWWPATPANEPTAHWSYLYVLLLASIYGPLGHVPWLVRVLQCTLVGILQPWLTYRIARRLFGDRVAVVSAAVVAGYAYFIYYAGSLMTEPLYFVAILWSVDTSQRLARPADSRSLDDAFLWLQLGLALATAILLRQVMLLTVPLFLGWIAWHRARNGHAAGRRWAGEAGWLKGAALAMLVIVMGILPWTVRNYRAFHEFVPLNTNAGFAFYWGNHPIHGTTFVPILPGENAYGKLIPAELRGLNEARLDKALLGLGLGFIADDPSRYVRLSISRAREYFRFWPSSDGTLVSNAARVLSFGVCLPFFAAGIVLAWRGWRTQPVTVPRSDVDPTLVLAFALGYSLIHCLTWTLVRYRLPVDAVLVPFAALAMVQLADFLVPRLGTTRRKTYS